jgi:hypothetical protein
MFIKPEKQKISAVIAVLFLLFFETIPAFPTNSFRGNALYWKNEFAEGRLLQELKELGYNKLYYQTGSIDLNSEGQIKKQGLTWSQEETEWEKKLSFDHYLEFNLTDNFVENFSLKSSWLTYPLFELLKKELEYYGGKFSGVILKLEKQGSSLPLSFGELRDMLAAERYKLGVAMAASAVTVAAVNWKKQPDFLLLLLTGEDVKNIAYLNRQAVSLNMPFQYAFIMQERILAGSRQVELAAGMERIFFRESLLMEKSEKVQEGVLYTEYSLKEPYSIDGLSLKVGEPVLRLRKTLNSLYDFIGLSAEISPFWYSGMAVHPGYVSARVLLKKEAKMAPPLLYYNIAENGLRFTLQLSMENPNPVRSEGRGKTGIGLYARGFRLKSLDLAEFSHLKAESDDRGNYFYFTRDELGPFSRTDKLELELEKISAQGEIGVMSWLKPEFAVETYYFPPGSSFRLPEYQLRSGTKTLWKND